MKRYRYIISMLLLFGLIYYGYTYYDVYIAENREKQIIEVIIPMEIEEEDIEGNDNVEKDSIGEITKETTEERTERTAKDVYDKKNDTESIPQDMDCILQIPSIDLNKIVYTGTNRKLHLEKYELVTASDDMQYMYGGNYIICGHASRLYGHSLNRLQELQVGDEVIIWNKGKSNQYIISSISFKNMNHTSTYCEQTEYPQLTIISCAKYVNDDKYIVIKCK